MISNVWPKNELQVAVLSLIKVGKTWQRAALLQKRNTSSHRGFDGTKLDKKKYCIILYVKHVQEQHNRKRVCFSKKSCQCGNTAKYHPLYDVMHIASCLLLVKRKPKCHHTFIFSFLMPYQKGPDLNDSLKYSFLPLVPVDGVNRSIGGMFSCGFVREMTSFNELKPVVMFLRTWTNSWWCILRANKVALKEDLVLRVKCLEL